MDPRRIGRTVDPRKRPHETSPTARPITKLPRVESSSSTVSNITGSAQIASKRQDSPSQYSHVGAAAQAPMQREPEHAASSHTSNDDLAKNIGSLLEHVTKQATLQIWNDQSKAALDRATREYAAVKGEGMRYPIIAEQKLNALHVTQEEHRLKAAALAQHRLEQQRLVQGVVMAMIASVQPQNVLEPMAEQSNDQTKAELETLTTQVQAISDRIDALETSLQSQMKTLAQNVTEASSRVERRLEETQAKMSDDFDSLKSETDGHRDDLLSRLENDGARIADLTAALEILSQAAKKQPKAHSPAPSVFPIIHGPKSIPNGTSPDQAAVPNSIPHAFKELQIKHDQLTTSLMAVQRQYDNLFTDEIVRQMVGQMMQIYPDVKNVQVVLDQSRDQMNQMQQTVSRLSSQFATFDGRVAKVESSTGPKSDPSIELHLTQIKTEAERVDVAVKGLQDAHVQLKRELDQHTTQLNEIKTDQSMLLDHLGRQQARLQVHETHLLERMSK